MSAAWRGLIDGPAHVIHILKRHGCDWADKRGRVRRAPSHPKGFFRLWLPRRGREERKERRERAREREGESRGASRARQETNWRAKAVEEAAAAAAADDFSLAGARSPTASVVCTRFSPRSSVLIGGQCRQSRKHRAEQTGGHDHRDSAAAADDAACCSVRPGRVCRAGVWRISAAGAGRALPFRVALALALT